MVDLAKLDAQKQSILKLVDGWTSSRLSFHPPLGGWSAAEVFDHLVKTEERILGAAKHGLSKPRRIGFSDRARTVFLRKVFESDRRVKVPSSATQVLPDEAPDIAAILIRWQAIRDDLAAFHAQLSAVQMRQGIFRHPVGGWMALPDVVEFFSVHMVHHTFQLDRLSAESNNL